MHLAHVDSSQAVARAQQALDRQGHRRLPFVPRSQLGQRAECARLVFAPAAPKSDTRTSHTVKWLGEGAISPLAIDGKQSNAEITSAIRQWCSSKGKQVVTPVVIVSYERLRMLSDELGNTEIGLLLADEGHRLKNAGGSLRFRERAAKLICLRSAQTTSHTRV